MVQAPALADCIVLDAGHGGHDSGASNPVSQLLEKDLSLEFVLELKENLERDHHRVVLTRDRDVFVSLDRRVELSHASGCNFFVSIHLNDAAPSIEGFETYYGLDRSRTFAFDFHQVFSSHMISRDRGVKRAAYRVISHSDFSHWIEAQEQKELLERLDARDNLNLKSILVEVFFIKNPLEVSHYWRTPTAHTALYEAVKANLPAP